MWFRPVLGIIINIGVSIALVRICGIYGVLIGTITADFFTFFLIDPKIIYKVSFENYRPVSDYYKKNVIYIIVLTVICFIDIQICSNVFINHGWLSVGIHIMMCAISVPVSMWLIFRKRHECQYIVEMAKRMFGNVVARFR